MNGQPPCVWPSCLNPDQERALLDAVEAAELGLSTEPMPDQRLVCRCKPEDVKTWET